VNLSQGNQRADSGRGESDMSGYLAGLAHSIAASSLEGELCREVRRHLLDAAAAALLGSRGKAFEDLARLCCAATVSCNRSASGVPGSNLLDAAMLWSFAIHSSVFEDGSREGACHPAAVVVPAVAVFSEGKDWPAVERAMIAGYDVMVRAARAGNPGFTLRGFHPTAVAGPLGAAAAASLLLGHDRRATQSALALAAMGGAGFMFCFRAGETQPLQVAWSVRNGLAAALMAGAGYCGHPRILEEAFYPAHLGSGPAVPPDLPLRYGYAIQGCYLKPYPGCRHLHPAIDALAQILSGTRIDPVEVKSVRVGTYRVALETEIETLGGRGDAYFNIPYALAARLVLGRSDWDSFDPVHFSDPAIVELMGKVSIAVDPEIDSAYPDERGSIVEICTAGGSRHAARVRLPLGEPENPLPDSFLLDKLRRSAGGLLTEEETGRIESLLRPAGPADPPGPLFAIACRACSRRQGAAR